MAKFFSSAAKAAKATAVAAAVATEGLASTLVPVSKSMVEAAKLLPQVTTVGTFWASDALERTLKGLRMTKEFKDSTFALDKAKELLEESITDSKSNIEELRYRISCIPLHGMNETQRTLFLEAIKKALEEPNPEPSDTAGENADVPLTEEQKKELADLGLL